MRRDIEWKEKLPDGAQRMIRVRFPGRGRICWQFKRSDEPGWDYDTPPSVADWDTLEEKINILYHRRRCAFKEVENVRTARQTALRR